MRTAASVYVASCVRLTPMGTGVWGGAEGATISVAIVEAVTKTPEVPFGDMFFNVCRFILTAVAPSQTRLTVTGYVKFIKQTMFKGALRRSRPPPHHHHLGR